MHRSTSRLILSHARRQLRPTALRTFSSATSNDNSTGRDPSASSFSLDQAKSVLFQAALQQVHEHGWTQEAISQAVVSSQLSVSLMGIMTPQDLITQFMDHCQESFETELETTYIPLWKNEQDNAANLSGRLETIIKLRLSHVLPYVESNTWHDGMALGATSNTTITASQLDRMVQSIASALVVGANHPPLGTVERTAIGALYISTELHLLADESQDYEATWTFLKSRVGEMQLLVEHADWTSVTNGNAAVAATAVATSLGGAVVSLLQPAARGAVSAAASTVVPHLATFLQPPQNGSLVGDGSRPSDYQRNANDTTRSKAKNETPVAN